MSQIEFGVSRCIWEGTGKTCSSRPPPTTPVFTIVVALLTMLAGLPIAMLLHFVLDTFCCRQPGSVPKPLEIEEAKPIVKNESPLQSQPNSDSFSRSGSYSANEKMKRSKSFNKVPFQDQTQPLNRTQSQVQFQTQNERIDPYRADGVYSTEESSKRICRSRSELGDVIRRVANVQPKASITDDDLARYAFTGKNTDLHYVVMRCDAL